MTVNFANFYLFSKNFRNLLNFSVDGEVFMVGKEIGEVHSNVLIRFLEQKKATHSKRQVDFWR